MKNKLLKMRTKTLFSYNTNIKFNSGKDTDPTTAMTNMTVTGVFRGASGK